MRFFYIRSAIWSKRASLASMYQRKINSLTLGPNTSTYTGLLWASRAYLGLYIDSKYGQYSYYAAKGYRFREHRTAVAFEITHA